MLTGLPKAFELSSHKLLLAKLNTYGFDGLSLKYRKNCLSDGNKIAEINSGFSNWTNILYSVLQIAFLGPLCIQYFSFRFIFIPLNIDIRSYTDDNTLYYKQIS